MLKRKKINILIVIIILIILSTLSVTSFLKNKTSLPQDDVSSSKNFKIEKQNVIKTEKTILEIDNKKYETEITNDANVYDLMEKLQKEKQINFKYKTYSGMGKFIEEINGIKNGEKNWIYYVNGKKANIGISNYKIKNGDVVSWKLESGI